MKVAMNSLRVRFAIGFSVLFTIFLAIALIIVYISYADFRKEEYYSRLKDKALTTFKLLVEVEQIDQELLQVIDRNTLNSLYEGEKVLVFSGNRLIYSSIADKMIRYNQELLSSVKLKKEIHTTQDDSELVALYIKQGGKEYTVLASAYDKYGRRKMRFLKWVMLIVYFLGLAIGWTATHFFVKKVIRPLDALKKDIQKITSDNLDIRLSQEGQGDEVDSLAKNFNQMLERLQQAFSIHKDFVHYASHELRTPIAAMVGITESALAKKISSEECQALLNKLYSQQQNLTSITNSLLLLSDRQVVDKEYPKIRLDELVFRSVEINQNLFPEVQIQVFLEGETQNEESLLIRANEPLLVMAFNNLLKNAIQYSTDNTAIVTIRFGQHINEVEFRNKGKLFTDEETKMIFTPFYRDSNSKNIKGHGLGLALVKQIADIHAAKVKYSIDGSFNVFNFQFQNN